MDLPIDHFRLLGVSPTTDGETVLRTLQQRLDRTPDEGFTHETLQARAELLQASAELLSDEERRQAYERELTTIHDTSGGAIAALEIPNTKEVGGLLLLMEAGQPQEAFEAAHRGLQPPQAPSLGSGREADLTLLAGLASQAAALDYRNQRRYEAAARILQQGLQLLQRMGQLPELRRTLDHDLQTLLPYRVLDLISRDLAADSARREGIALLEQLVQQRGGLEGDLDPSFPASEFQPFFQQIRQFLTVQEQLDLFSRWAEAGSSRADLLASIALTAAGFVQRKPERIQAACQRLQSSDQAGVQVAMACQQLLLGQVEQAQALFERGADEQQRRWAREQSEDALARLCAFCRDWLNRQVLPDFRDIEADADLEAWFADRDVQAYVDQQDRIRRRQQPSRSEEVADPAASTATIDELPAWPDFSTRASDSTAESADMAWPGDDGPPEAEPADADNPDENEDDVLWSGPSWRWPQLPALTLPRLTRPALPALPEPRWALAVAAGIGVLAAGGGWLLLRQRSQPPRPIAVQPAPLAQPPSPPAKAKAPLATPDPALPLTVAEPDERQLQLLLETWLDAKTSLLAGSPAPQPLDQLARPALVSQLEQQLAANRSAGATETVKASVESLTISERSPGRIAADVVLRYSDERRNNDGIVLSSTPTTSLRNTYVFGRDGEVWHLAAFQANR